MQVGQVTVVGVVGRDGFGWELKEALAARGIDGSRLVEAVGVQTFTYTKVINGETGEEDRPRLDFIVNRPLREDVERALVAQFSFIRRPFDSIARAGRPPSNRP